MKTATLVVPYGGFRLPPKPGGNKRPINMAFFESFCYLIFCMGDCEQEMIKMAYDILLHDERYVFTLTHSVDSNIQIENRYNRIRETIEQLKA